MNISAQPRRKPSLVTATISARFAEDADWAK